MAAAARILPGKATNKHSNNAATKFICAQPVFDQPGLGVSRKQNNLLHL